MTHYRDIENWKQKLEYLKQFILNNKKIPSIYSLNKNERTIGSWYKTQRTNNNRNKKIFRNEIIQYLWDNFINTYIERKIINSNIKNSSIEIEKKWEAELNKIKKYIDDNNKFPFQDKKLFNWLTKQNYDFNKNIGLFTYINIIHKWLDFMKEYNLNNNIIEWYIRLDSIIDYIEKNKKMNIFNKKWIKRQIINKKIKRSIFVSDKYYIIDDLDAFVKKYNYYLFIQDCEYEKKIDIFKNYILSGKVLKSRNKIYCWFRYNYILYMNKCPLSKRSLYYKKIFLKFISDNKYFIFNNCSLVHSLWHKNYKKLKTFIEQHNKLPSPNNSTENELCLYNWLKAQNYNFNNNEYIMICDEIKNTWRLFRNKYINNKPIYDQDEDDQDEDEDDQDEDDEEVYTLKLPKIFYNIPVISFTE